MERGERTWEVGDKGLIRCERHCTGVRCRTFSLQDESMEMMERQMVCTDRAGDQSSVSMLRQMCPLE